ncbi:sugar-binding transcriptional regulator [Halonatronum saccharophilum]|uniref:sugar-binding transcriptional regulator n=1 Tax=Halonatronum saccharophilum TaxID=150060 RepID=UPI00048930BD|nr:sugar-binding domain-containing protein [Halonatronum saccharophilum]
MADYLKLQKRIAPEIFKVIERRYEILKLVERLQPIGRRSLAQELDLSERTIRKHLDFLKDKKFIDTTSAGAVITLNGGKMLRELELFIKELKGTSKLEKRLGSFLAMEVHILPKSINSTQVKEELGRFAAYILKDMISYGEVIAVTGGTTLSTLAEAMTPVSKNLNITVVPARGGLGEEVEIQSNTIAAKIAKKLGGEYYLLHTPDNLKKETISTLIKEPSIKKVLDLAKRADVLIHGIGTAQVMAKRRGMPLSEIEKLKKAGAVGEAFGYYFNQVGKIVYSTESVGLKLSDLAKIKKVVAIAEGKNKAKAILASVSKDYQDILIVDEDAAMGILELIDQENKVN